MHTLHQPVQRRRCDLLHLDPDRSLRSDLPVSQRILSGGCEQERIKRLRQASEECHLRICQ